MLARVHGVPSPGGLDRVLRAHGLVLHRHQPGQAGLQGQHGRAPATAKTRDLSSQADNTQINLDSGCFPFRENMDSFEIGNYKTRYIHSGWYSK